MLNKTLTFLVSQTLPTTSYVKMVEVWLIFNLFIPFSEVLLHTYMDYLRLIYILCIFIFKNILKRDDESREINNHGVSKPAVSASINKTVSVKVASMNDPENLFNPTKPKFSDLISRNEKTQVDVSIFSTSEYKLDINYFIGSTKKI